MLLWTVTLISAATMVAGFYMAEGYIRGGRIVGRALLVVGIPGTLIGSALLWARTGIFG